MRWGTQTWLDFGKQRIPPKGKKFPVYSTQGKQYQKKDPWGLGAGGGFLLSHCDDFVMETKLSAAVKCAGSALAAQGSLVRILGGDMALV